MGFFNDLEGFSDTNWISNSDETKATRGYIFSLAGGVVAWRSCKQSIISLALEVIPHLVVS